MEGGEVGVSSQSVGHSVETLSDTPMYKEEEDIICIFLSSFRPEDPSWDSQGMSIKQIGCKSLSDDSFQSFEGEIYNKDKVKVHIEKLPSHAKTLFEERGDEVNTQPLDYPAETWRGTLLAQEEEVISKFLLSLQLEDLSQVNPFDDNLILRRDEVKMPLDENLPVKFLVEKKRYENDLQHSGDSTGVLRDALLIEEEEIIDKFLSSLQPDHLSQDDSDIHSNQVENEILISESSFLSSIYGFSDLDCGSSAGKCDGILGKEKDGMY